MLVVASGLGAERAQAFAGGHGGGPGWAGGWGGRGFGWRGLGWRWGWRGWNWYIPPSRFGHYMPPFNNSRFGNTLPGYGYGPYGYGRPVLSGYPGSPYSYYFSNSGNGPGCVWIRQLIDTEYGPKWTVTPACAGY
jgi:hypothetical protein